MCESLHIPTVTSCVPITHSYLVLLKSMLPIWIFISLSHKDLKRGPAKTLIKLNIIKYKIYACAVSFSEKGLIFCSAWSNLLPPPPPLSFTGGRPGSSVFSLQNICSMCVWTSWTQPSVGQQSLRPWGGWGSFILPCYTLSSSSSLSQTTTPFPGASWSASSLQEKRLWWEEEREGAGGGW